MKFKANAHISWEFEYEGPDATKEAVNQLNSMLPGHVVFRMGSVAKPLSKQTKITLGIFTLEEVFPYLTNNNVKREYKCGDKSYLVRMNSHRYFVFKNSAKCSACGLEGTKFLLEKHERDSQPHFNLYGEENGELVMMTKDHIVPKSCGGGNVMSNYVCMCSICNNLKGDTLISYKGLGKLREIYNENKRSLPHKKLAEKIKQEKEKILVEEKVGLN